jgi:hypothetical protein
MAPRGHATLFFVTNSSALVFRTAPSHRPMTPRVVTLFLSHMIFRGYASWEFSLHLGFNIAMLEIAKRLPRSTINLTSKWMTMIPSLTIRNANYAMSASSLSRPASCETFDLRNREIEISRFGVSGYRCTCR